MKNKIKSVKLDEKICIHWGQEFLTYVVQENLSAEISEETLNYRLTRGKSLVGLVTGIKDRHQQLLVGFRM